MIRGEDARVFRMKLEEFERRLKLLVVCHVIRNGAETGAELTD